MYMYKWIKLWSNSHIASGLWGIATDWSHTTVIQHFNANANDYQLNANDYQHGSMMQ